MSLKRRGTPLVALALLAAMMSAIFVACDSHIMPTAADFPPGLVGTVTNAVTKARVSGATVEAQGKTTATDTNGFYSIDNLRVGTYLVKATHPDYIDNQREVPIASFNSQGDFELQPKP